MLPHNLFYLRLGTSISRPSTTITSSSLILKSTFCSHLIKINLLKLINNKSNAFILIKRAISTRQRPLKSEKIRTTAHYTIATTIAFLAFSYASVPLYRIYCQTTGKGGRAFIAQTEEKIAKMNMNEDRKINVSFVADTNSAMAWNFKPTQNVMEVLPGETALAFFTAKNPLNRPVSGVATYSVMPYEAGLYFNKIQCFCFEEQMLNPNEEVDLPVFFYIDPEFVNDPRLELVSDVVLSYTFFEARKSTKWTKYFGNLLNFNSNWNWNG